MSLFLGVDGGGTKTAYALIDAAGICRARHVGPSVSHLAAGFERAQALLVQGIEATLATAGVQAADLKYAYLGLPAYGEDSGTTALLDAMPRPILRVGDYQCGNDMVCSWAGSLGGGDGISVIAGTGSMAYGVYAGRSARAGGWGEVIGDEGSGYWIAREGLALFSRMSDGRAPRRALYDLVRVRFGILTDLDLCSHINGMDADPRRAFAQFAPLVHEAALAGDALAAGIFERGALELVQCVIAVHASLGVPAGVVLRVSHSGGALDGATLMRESFRREISRAPVPLEYRTPLFAPDMGAALHAARLSGEPIVSVAAARAD